MNKNPKANDSPIQDIQNDLQKAIRGEVRTDLVTRLLYSTDASIYQIEPLGVVFPKTTDELAEIMRICSAYRVPVLARGSGSSLAGQAIGPAMIVDCSRHLNKIIEINPDLRNATVDPGVILARLNREAARHGLQFGPDPASAERATLGGCLGNNATGAHSITYGMAVDNLVSAQVVLSDGAETMLESVSISQAARKATGNDVQAQLYRTTLEIREKYEKDIMKGWPRTWRRVSGYNLNYLLPWTPDVPPNWYSHSHNIYPPIHNQHVNLASLIAGSEGTLAIFKQATISMVPLPRSSILGVLRFTDIPEACDAVPTILTHKPAAIELIPQTILRLARSVPAYANQLTLLNQLGDPKAILVVEFAGDSCLDELREKVRNLEVIAPVVIAEGNDKEQVWAIRKVGLGILMSMPGDQKPWSFIEDLAVPVDHLGEFIREIDIILADHHTTAEIYAHASAGCLHIRPILNLKTVEGVFSMRSIAHQAVALTLRLGGAVSGEHGDGIARSEWLEMMYGEEIIKAFCELKQAADPHNLLNPGKIIAPVTEQVMEMDKNLRFGPDYRSTAWTAWIDFSGQRGLEAAIEQCNGAGVCRKEDGLMCPSFQATRDELHSTRGRANILRAMISGRFPTRDLSEHAVYEAFELCLACKGCKSECPSGVDMAKLKYEFLQYYYSAQGGGNRRRLRDYLFGYVGILSQMSQPFSKMVNFISGLDFVSGLGERYLGLARKRPFPKFASRTLSRQWHADPHQKAICGNMRGEGESVLFLSDAFTEFFFPEIGMAALSVLKYIGVDPIIIPVIGAGRTLISRGILEPARMHAEHLISTIKELSKSESIPVVGVEPSEIYTLCDEYRDMVPTQYVRELGERVFTIEEYLVRKLSKLQLIRIANNYQEKTLLHTHCYQKTRAPHADGYPTGSIAVRNALELFGYQVKLIDAGCCGMAGAFGYESEHYQLSLQIGELALFPRIRSAEQGIKISASGVSCRTQISEGTNRKTYHPIELIFQHLSVQKELTHQ